MLNYFPTGYVFFHEGDQIVEPDGSMFIIKHGTVKITRKEREVSVLADNDFFGEMALVLSEPRNATATAIAECELFQLKKLDLIKLMETSKTLSSKISTGFLERVKQNNKETPAK